MPAKSLGNIAFTYDSLALAPYMDQGSLEMTVDAIETTTLASTAKENTPGVPSFSVPIGGPWAKALDDKLGADASSPPTSLRTFVGQIGPVGNRVTYTWTSAATVGAFISDYKIDASDPLGVIKWSGTLTVSGATVRA